MRKLLTTALLMLLVFASVESVCAYTNDRYGFSIDPPSGWTIEEPSWAAVAFVGPTIEDFRVNINIQVESTSLPLAQYVSASKTTILAMYGGSDFILLAEGPRNRINNVDAYELVFTLTSSGRTVKDKQVYLVNGGKGFVITYTALSTTYQEYLPDFETSVQTFNIGIVGLNWLLIIAIVAVVVAIGAAAAIILVRRTKRKAPQTPIPPPPTLATASPLETIKGIILGSDVVSFFLQHGKRGSWPRPLSAF